MERKEKGEREKEREMGGERERHLFRKERNRKRLEEARYQLPLEEGEGLREGGACFLKGQWTQVTDRTITSTMEWVYCGDRAEHDIVWKKYEDFGTLD